MVLYRNYYLIFLVPFTECISPWVYACSGKVRFSGLGRDTLLAERTPPTHTHIHCVTELSTPTSILFIQPKYIRF